MIKDQISRIQSNISLICQKLERNPDEITLVGVTKFASMDKVKEALEAGLTDIGENKVQEAEKKFPELVQAGFKFKRHMIGHLQSNKAKQAVEQFDLIQSVDSLKLAKELDKQGQKLNRIIDILIQVNTSGEEQKFGVAGRDARQLIEQTEPLKNIRVLGLMTIGPLTDDENVMRKCFGDLHLLFELLKESYKGSDKVIMKYLSMGMTNDFEIALEEGANMLRIGSAIFKDE